MPIKVYILWKELSHEGGPSHGISGFIQRRREGTLPVHVQAQKKAHGEDTV